MVQQMIPVKEEGEKAVLSEEDREMEEEEEEEGAAAAEESVEDGSGSEEDDGDEEPKDASHENGDEKEEDTKQTLDKTKKDTPLPGEPKEKKPSDSLNVNNEVVKMRKEVKRVRALIIRKLTRQIGKLKNKKGKEADIERNQRRAGRLLEEIHAMKALLPDKVGLINYTQTFHSLLVQYVIPNRKKRKKKSKMGSLVHISFKIMTLVHC